MYLLGIDGGGTKTHCIIGDEHGNIFAEGFGGPANYDCVGIEVTKRSIETAIKRALDKLNISIDAVSYAYLGLAGADYKEDYDILEAMCKTIFNQVPFKVVNDCLIALRAGSDVGWGVVSVCGTGHGALGRTLEGESFTLRNMTYELGNRGGGGELVREALHHAFRGDEGVGPFTRLQQEIPLLYGVETMGQVDECIRAHTDDTEMRYQIPVLVARLAKERDKVSQELLIKMGSALGQTAAALIRRMGVMDKEVPVVLAGSVFTSDNPLVIDAYQLEIHKVAPYAKFIILKQKPVIGAYELSRDEKSRT